MHPGLLKLLVCVVNKVTAVIQAGQRVNICFPLHFRVHHGVFRGDGHHSAGRLQEGDLRCGIVFTAFPVSQQGKPQQVAALR